jgi:hypothetical protein
MSRMTFAHWFGPEQREFTMTHVAEWFEAKHSPDWDADRIAAFTEWAERNAAEWPMTAGWPEIARAFAALYPIRSHTTSGSY